MNKNILIFAIIGLLFLSSCANLSSEEILAKVKEASSKVNTYTSTMETITSLSYSDGSSPPVKFSMSGDTIEDIPNEKMKTSLKIKGLGNDLKGGSESMFDTDIYLIGDELYSKSFLGWTKQKVEGPEFAQLWDQTNQFKNMNEFLDLGKLEIIGEQQMGGQDYYVGRLDIDFGKLIEKLGSYLSAGNNDLAYETPESMTKLFKSADYTIDVWVNKESFFPERYVY